MAEEISNQNDVLFGWKSISSWEFVGWWVAIAIGIGGAFMGIGMDYPMAALWFSAAIVLSCVKWGHHTRMYPSGKRRWGYFLPGCLLLICLCVCGDYWLRKKQAEEDNKSAMFEKLAVLPKLQARVESIPNLQQQIKELQKQLGDAQDASKKKEETIEGLSKTIISQQGVIALAADKQFKAVNDLITGGPSYVYIEFDLPIQYMQFHKRGDQPLYDVVARIECGHAVKPVGLLLENRIWEMHDFPTGGRNSAAFDEIKSINELPPENRLCDFTPIPRTAEPIDHAMFGVDFTARNGSWHEMEWLRLVNGRWISGVRVTRLREDGKRDVLFEFIPSEVEELSRDPHLQ